jgi:hypothetical protein
MLGKVINVKHDNLKQGFLQIFIAGLFAVNAVASLAPSNCGSPTQAGSHAPKAANMKFIPVTTGEIIDNEGTSLGFRTVGADQTKLAVTAFETSNGAKLSLQQGTFRSEEEATRYFDRMVGTSSEILKQGRKLNKKGKPVGWRAEIVLTPLGVGNSSRAILWTNEKRFQEILTDSLSDAEELEKRYGD